MELQGRHSGVAGTVAAHLLHVRPPLAVRSRAAARNNRGRGDLAWLPPFFSFSPAVTCKTKGTHQAYLLSVFFLFRFVSLQIIFLVSPSSPLLQMAGDKEEGRTREGQADRGVTALRNPLERTDHRPFFLLWSTMRQAEVCC